jgi:hypothetical protein
MFVIAHWPSNIADEIPADVPDAIASLYRQALLCHRQGAWDAAGMTLRKTLEVSTKTLDTNLASKTLAARIEALYDSQKLTADIKDWAHEIRLDGNAAVHESESFDAAQVEGLKQFTEAYLRYIYTLPALVESSRKRRSPSS